MKKILLLSSLLLPLFVYSLLNSLPNPAEPEKAVTRVIDGDTVELEDGEKVRYLGIDSPEIAYKIEARDQKAESRSECFAMEATEINRNLVEGKKVRLESDRDRYDNYGRTLAWVFAVSENDANGSDETNGTDGKRETEKTVNYQLILRGAGRFFGTVGQPRMEDGRLMEAENEARLMRRGLWGECGKINGQCLVKANYTTNGQKYYHLPGFRHYQQTVVNQENGDRWFCSADEAEAAGFKRARE